MTENEIAKIVLDLAFDIHKLYGPGLLESVYEKILSHELKITGFDVKTQVPIKLIHNDEDMGTGFYADIILEDKVILELKSVKHLEPVHYKQLLTYLKLTDYKLGLLINFNEALLKNGIKRIVNKI